MPFACQPDCGGCPGPLAVCDRRAWTGARTVDLEHAGQPDRRRRLHRSGAAGVDDCLCRLRSPGVRGGEHRLGELAADRSPVLVQDSGAHRCPRTSPWWFRVARSQKVPSSPVGGCTVTSACGSAVTPGKPGPGRCRPRPLRRCLGADGTILISGRASARFTEAAAGEPAHRNEHVLPVEILLCLGLSRVDAEKAAGSDTQVAVQPGHGRDHAAQFRPLVFREGVRAVDRLGELGGHAGADGGIALGGLLLRETFVPSA